MQRPWPGVSRDRAHLRPNRRRRPVQYVDVLVADEGAVVIVVVVAGTDDSTSRATTDPLGTTPAPGLSEITWPAGKPSLDT
jgi:hypothetical protein